MFTEIIYRGSNGDSLNRAFINVQQISSVVALENLNSQEEQLTDQCECNIIMINTDRFPNIVYPHYYTLKKVILESYGIESDEEHPIEYIPSLVEKGSVPNSSR